MTLPEIVQAVRANEPFKGLPNIRIQNLTDESGAADGDFDAKFDLRFGDMNVKVYAEIKTNCSPKQVEQLAPWLSRMKAVRKDAAFALVCPALSPRSQSLCMERGVDFIDLAGNLSINVPGKLLIQRTGQKVPEKITASFYRNPFSGKSSRIVRVLLQQPKSWTLSEIIDELNDQTQSVRCPSLTFEVSAGFASRVLRSLEEQVLVVARRTGPGWLEGLAQRRAGKQPQRDSAFSVPEPKRLLDTWAEKYRERFRWNMRNAVRIPNPFGADVKSVQKGLTRLFEPAEDEILLGKVGPEHAPPCYAFTSAAATSITAPYVDADVIDLFVPDTAEADRLGKAITRRGPGPDLRVIPAYDAGVFLYASELEGIPIVSDIQAYLDLFARGGRDLKQADYLFEKRIAPAWAGK